MRPALDRHRGRDYRNLVDQYRHQQQQQQPPHQQQPDSPQQKLVLPVLPSKGPHTNSRSNNPRDAYITDSEDIHDALGTRIQRMEASMAAQAQTIVDLKQELTDLKMRRNEEVSIRDALTSFAAHEALEEERVKHLGSMLRLLNEKVEILERQAGDISDRDERRLATIESRLNGVMDVRRILNAQMKTAEDLTSTATAVSAQQSIVDGLQSEVDKVTRSSEAGNIAAHAVRNEMAKICAEFRRSLSSEAASTRAVIAEEGAARQDLGLALERRQTEVARTVQGRSEATAQAICERIDDLEASLQNERQARASAIERALDELERQFESVGRLRQADRDANKSETEAMRTALQVTMAKTDERIDGVQHSIELLRQDLTESLAKSLRDHRTALSGLGEMTSGRIEEIESVLSAEIAARRTDVGKIASRVDDAEERCRCDVVTSTNRMTELILMLEKKCHAQFDDCNQRFGSEFQKARRESCDYTDQRIRRIKDLAGASIAATSAKIAIHRRNIESEQQKSAVRHAQLQEEMESRSQRAVSRTKELRQEVERWRKELRSGMVAETSGLSARMLIAVDGIQAERAALDARRQEGLRHDKYAIRAHVRDACTELETRLRTEMTDVACSIEQAVIITREGLYAESVASAARSREDTGRCDLLASETIAREELMREALLAETRAAVGIAEDLVSREAREREADANAAVVEWRRAIAASESSLREVIEYGDSRLQTQFIDASAKLSNAIASEGRAARATARALVEQERTERTDDAAAALKSTTDLVAATTARLESAAKGYHAQGTEHIESLIAAESEKRIALAKSLQKEAEGRARDYDDRETVSNVLHSTIDLIADSAMDRREARLETEIHEAIQVSTCNVNDVSQKLVKDMAEIDARFEVNHCLKAAVDAVVDRDIQKALNEMLESSSKGNTENADNLRTSIGKVRLDLEQAILDESREREELAAKLLDETSAREEDSVIRHNVLWVMCHLVDIVAAEDSSAERRAAQDHMRQLSSRVDQVTADLTVESARVSAQSAAHASSEALIRVQGIRQGLGTSNAIVAISTEISSAIDHAVNHEIEARQNAVEQTRELSEAKVADAMIRCNESIARAEERIRINMEELKITTGTSNAVLRNDLDLLKKRVSTTSKATALAPDSSSLARAPAQSSDTTTSAKEASAPLTEVG